MLLLHSSGRGIAEMMTLISMDCEMLSHAHAGMTFVLLLKLINLI